MVQLLLDLRCGGDTSCYQPALLDLLLSVLCALSMFLIPSLLLIILYGATKAEQILWVTWGTLSKIKVKDRDGQKNLIERILYTAITDFWLGTTCNTIEIFIPVLFLEAMWMSGSRPKRLQWGLIWNKWMELCPELGRGPSGGGVLIPLLSRPLVENRIRAHRCNPL